MDNIIDIMKNTIITFNISIFDTLAFYDAETNKIIVISARSFVKKDFENYAVINKTSDLLGCGQIKLVNLADFIKKNPCSGIEAYIEAEHTDKLFYFDFYIAAYITLYKHYKSLETISANGLFGFIDTFIDHCVSIGNDHPGTITYYNYDHEIHTVLKLRKTVYDMFEQYITTYSNYYYIFVNQHEYEYTDKQFREFRKTLRDFKKAKRALEKARAAAEKKSHLSA